MGRLSAVPLLCVSLALGACSGGAPKAVQTSPAAPGKWSPGYSADAARAMAATFGKTALKPGEFVWRKAPVPDGPTAVIVSIGSQMAYVYRSGQLIGAATVSSGMRGHETPRGIFPVLEKRKVHKSNRYSNAPMPYMQRLNWHGVALHGGTIPGHPASHGCVRLPMKFAEKLFDLTSVGSRVVIED